MYFMESRQKEDEEVSSQATTLQFGSHAKSGYVCPGYPRCEDMGCDCAGPETEVDDVKEDEQEAPRQNEILNAKLGNGKGNGRNGGRAPPNKGRKAK